MVADVGAGGVESALPFTEIPFSTGLCASTEPSTSGGLFSPSGCAAGGIPFDLSGAAADDRRSATYSRIVGVRLDISSARCQTAQLQALEIRQTLGLLVKLLNEGETAMDGYGQLLKHYERQ